jgi:hypothetical protein
MNLDYLSFFSGVIIGYSLTVAVLLFFSARYDYLTEKGKNIFHGDIKKFFGFYIDPHA